MFQIQKIESLDLPELQPYRTMRRQMEHRAQGIFVAEGEKVVRRLLESGLGVVSLLLPEKWLNELEPLLKQRPENVAVYIGEKKLLEQLTGFSMYQGLLAIGKVPAPVTLEDLLLRLPRPRFLVAVDGLSNAENLGAVMRNCAAFSVQGLLVAETSASPFLRRAVRSSMGAVFELPVVELVGLATALGELRKEGIRVIAAHPPATGRALHEADFTRDCCVVFGSEGYGISTPVMESCDEAVAIPMPQKVDSLNVASAAAVFLYEINRQRRAAKTCE